MSPHYTYCEFHLGDNLIHLHFLRRLAAANHGHSFFHYVHECHLAQLIEVVEDLNQIFVLPLESKPTDAINVWKNAGAGTAGGGFFENHTDQSDFCAFHLAWFSHLATKMGLGPVLFGSDDLLFDYPAIKNPINFDHACEILFINSQPCSGQCLAYDSVDYFDDLIGELWSENEVVVTQASKAWPEVPCTKDYRLTVTEIARLSLSCKYIIGVATGPIWPTFNVWNQESVELRAVMLGNGENLNLGARVEQAADLGGIRAILQRAGMLS